MIAPRSALIVSYSTQWFRSSSAFLVSPVHFGTVILSPLLLRESLTESFPAYFRSSSFTSDGDLIWCFLRLVDLLTELRFLRA